MRLWPSPWLMAKHCAWHCYRGCSNSKGCRTALRARGKDFAGDNGLHQTRPCRSSYLAFGSRHTDPQTLSANVPYRSRIACMVWEIDVSLVLREGPHPLFKRTVVIVEIRLDSHRRLVW